jgi:CRISPR-associated protein Cas2
MLTVIAYDLTDDRRRERVSTLLEDYGRRVNYSVFECELTGQEFAQLHMQLAQLIDARQDRVVFYRVCESCRGRRATLGLPWQEDGGTGIVIV